MRLLAHLFLPHSGNDYKAKLIRPSGIFGLLVFVVVLQIVVTYAVKGGLVLGEKVYLSSEKIVEETNQRRIKAGLPPLNIDSNLMAAAATKGADMLARDYWAHFSPQGTSPWSFFIKAGYQYKFAGENLARDFSSPRELVSAWIASPTHRDNLLSAKYQDVGVAVVQGELEGVPTTLVVQLLGSKSDLLSVGSRSRGEQIGVSTQPQLAQKTSVIVSSFATKRNIALSILGLLILVLVVDAVVLSRANIVRISGRTLAHIGFMGTVGLLLFMSRQGSIL